jgi:hypothetical protein
MDKTLTKALVIGGSALAGGAAGSWASAQALARFGYRLGPWGMMAGAVLGALAGAAMSGKLGGQQSGPVTLEGESELGTD